jgi:transcriptional regulator with XRE-family HTH domain
MGFRENLKDELSYKGIMVKELAAISGVNKRSIDSYLLENGSIPSAEAAVKIARALGVTVEYLVTGREMRHESAFASLNPELRKIIRAVGHLPESEQKIVFKTTLCLVDELNRRAR